ncbi:MAG: dockerin type I repeat-containing protein [Spirochaetales bacterium]|nr:dockerin type I repeat-containing protein [Spirochaetales bacterium]
MKKTSPWIKKTTLLFLFLFCTAVLAPSQTVIGDTNSDGNIDITDSLRVAQYYVGLIPANFDTQAADANCDGAIDIVDALLIARYYVGLIGEFADCLTPTPVPQGAEDEELIQNWAKENRIDLTGYRRERISDESVDYILPGFVFYSVYLNQWPVAYGPPDEQLGENSIVAIDAGRTVILIRDESYLQSFFIDNQITLSTPEDRIEMIKAWLGLSQEMKNDGYYSFLISEDDIVVTHLIGDAVEWEVTGTSTVSGGGEGYITARAVIDVLGSLMYVDEEYELIAGIRPICQSTLLLNPNTVIRTMAEQDLLVMGTCAQHYLFSWRQRLEPELQLAVERIWQRILLREESRKRLQSRMRLRQKMDR